MRADEHVERLPNQDGDLFTAALSVMWPSGVGVPPQVTELLPRPTVSYEEWLRFTGEDLNFLSPQSMRNELTEIQAALGRERGYGTVPWLTDRIARLRARLSAVGCRNPDPEIGRSG